MTQQLYTRGQLERELSQKIQAFYRSHLGHRPSKVTCQLFDTKLAVIVEDSITNAEQILFDEGKDDLAKKVRSNLENAIQPDLEKLIEEITKVEVLDMLSDATLETRRTGTKIIINKTPQIRNPENVVKNKSKT